MTETGGETRPVRVWDWPVRIVHWSFVLLLPALWATYKAGEMWWHQRSGFIVLSLVAFRIFWGLTGSATARFAGFVRGPGAIIAYLRGLFSKEAVPVVGHNPLGGWSVVALLLLLAAAVGSGLFAQDTDALETGPLAYLVSYETADWAREWHETIFNVLLGFVALHIAAILFYLITKRDNLIGAMIHGNRALPAAVVAPAMAQAWRAAIGAVGAMMLTWWVSLGCPLL